MRSCISNRLNINIVAIALCMMAIVLLPGSLSANESAEKGAILIIASYNPDTKRMSSFISEFEAQLNKTDLPFEIMIEDMGCKGVDEAHLWSERMANLLDKHDQKRLRAIVLLGQEAWASFLSQDSIPKGVPFFGSFASANGIKLPTSSTNIDEWMPSSIDMEALASSKGCAGGNLNHYDLNKNINMITALYPDVKHIAFVSDNTYGGISLQSFVRSQAANFPEIEFVFVDGRHGEQEYVKKISSLPSNSAILMGTWRVGGSGQYLMHHSMDNLVATNPGLPVFSMTGTGMGQAAIGGFMPRYVNGAEVVITQINKFYNGKQDAFSFVSIDGEYRFDRKKLNSFGIEDYKLPENSIITDDTEEVFRKYKTYLMGGGVALGVLITFIIFLFYLYYRNKALKDVLVERESELIAAKDRAEESDRLKSAFLANMSHEIRTPLNAIVGFSSLLGSELDARERAEYSNIISTNSTLMLNLINDILDISRLESGRLVFNMAQTDLVAICQQTIMTTAYNRKAGVECSLVCDYDTYMINTDAQRLTQVLINLLTNAGKFTKQGSITVSFRELPGEDLVEFSVTDTGCGIPADQQSKVFDRFEKLDEFQQGTGLGLSICKQICLCLGGKIWVDSSYTNGSRFVFTHSTKR